MLRINTCSTSPATISGRSTSRCRVCFSLILCSQDAKLDSAAFRQLQLDFRQAEVEEIVQILRRINEGMGDEIFTLNSRGEGQHLGGWQGRLAMNKTSVGGHSFGATLAVGWNAFRMQFARLTFNSFRR